MKRYSGFRPGFLLRVLVLWNILLAQLPAGWAQGQNQTVSCEDSRIQYEGGWVPQASGPHMYSNLPGSSFSFTFQGSAIYWYTANEPRGGVSSLQVDSDSAQLIDVSTGTNDNSPIVVAPMFIQTGLDETVSHTLRLTFIGAGMLGGPYSTIYYLVFTSGDGSEAALAPTFAPASDPAPTPSPTPNHASPSPKVTTTTEKNTILITQQRTTSLTQKSTSVVSTTINSHETLSVTLSYPFGTSSRSDTENSTVHWNTGSESATVASNTMIINTGALSRPSIHPNGSAGSASEVTRHDVGAIAGGVAGSLIGLVIVGAIVWLCLSRMRRKYAKDMDHQAATPFTEIRRLPTRMPVTIERDLSTYRASFSKTNLMHGSSISVDLDPFRRGSYPPEPIKAEPNSADTDAVSSPGSTENNRRNASSAWVFTTSTRDNDHSTNAGHGSIPLALEHAWYLLSQSDIVSQPPPEYQR